MSVPLYRALVFGAGVAGFFGAAGLLISAGFVIVFGTGSFLPAYSFHVF